MGEGTLGTGRQMAMPVEDKGALLACTMFRLWCVEGSVDFAELSGITSEVEHHDYSEAGMLGSFYSRHVGRRKPPSITLKRAMRTGLSTTWVWAWHQLACRGLPGMQRDCVLMLYGPNSDPNMPAATNYTLMNAFPTKIELSGSRAGGTELIYQTLTLQCDDMLDGSLL
jgi:phage tail-like protein